MKLRSLLLAAFTSLFVASFAQDITVNGTVYDKDSITPMQFAYVVNKNSTNGMVADAQGKFNLKIRLGDTLSFSYVGYTVTKVFTHKLKDSVKNSTLKINVLLKPKAKELNTVTVTTYGFSKEQKESYKRKIDAYKREASTPFVMNNTGAGLNIDALYYLWSKKGKQLQKLSLLYDQLLIDEIKEVRLNPERVRSITGNDTLDVKEFLNYCFLPDQFVVSASDYELYILVVKYYQEYTARKRKSDTE